MDYDYWDDEEGEIDLFDDWDSDPLPESQLFQMQGISLNGKPLYRNGCGEVVFEDFSLAGSID